MQSLADLAEPECTVCASLSERLPSTAMASWPSRFSQALTTLTQVHASGAHLADVHRNNNTQAVLI